MECLLAGVATDKDQHNGVGASISWPHANLDRSQDPAIRANYFLPPPTSAQVTTTASPHLLPNILDCMHNGDEHGSGPLLNLTSPPVPA